MKKSKNQKKKSILLRDNAENRLSPNGGTVTETSAQLSENTVNALQDRLTGLLMMNEELRKANIASETARDRYADLYNSAPVGFFTLTGMAVISDVNLTGTSMLGAERGKLIGSRFRTYISSEDIEVWDRHFINVLQLGEKQTCDLEIRRADDSVLSARLESIRTERSGKDVISIVISDITERLCSEAALWEIKERYHTIYNKTPVMLHSINTAGRLISVSDYWLEILGYERNEVIGRKLTDFFTEESARYAQEIVFPLFLQNGSVSEIAYRLVKKSGEIIDALVSSISERDKHGNILQSLDVIIDVTYRKQAKEALKTSEIRYRRLFESAKDGILILDAETGIVLDVNPFLIEMLGFSYEAFCDKYIWELGFFWDIVANKAKFLELQQKEYIRYENMPLKTSDGRSINVEFVSNVYLVNQHKVIQCNIRDITERRKVEEELHKAKAIAEDSTRAKSEFLATMSHEIRTPMNGVIGLTDLLVMTDMTDIQRSYLDNIRYSAYYLLDIINDILDISKIEAGRLEIENISFNLSDIIEKTSLIMTHRCSEKGITLLTKIEPDIPRFLIGDPVRIRQIVLNLLGNAVKFTEKGEIRISVNLTPLPPSQREGGVSPLSFGEGPGAGFITISVSDTGIGIPADRLGTIFKSFTQADGSVTRKYGGTGLGLTISKKLAELMNGSITVESTPGKGSCFNVNLRLLFADNQSLSEKQSKEYRDKSETPLSYSGTVLIAEDNPINMLVIRTHLAEKGFRIIEAVNGKEAYKKYCENEIDLVFMDVHMPEMNGYEATRKIREFEAGKKHTRIIALTADAFSGDRDRCLSEGMDFFVAKPFRPEEILSVIRRVMSDKSEPASKDSSAGPQIKKLQVFDWDGFLCRLNGNKKLCDEMLGKVLEEFPKQLSVLSSLIEKQDMKEIRCQSHSIKGMCLNIGADVFAEQAEKIEHIACNNGKIEEIKFLHASLEPAFKDFCREAGKYLSDREA